jgi:hypothetical protein
MKSPDDKTGGSSGLPPESMDSDSGEAGLPGLRTWRAVYTFVLVTFGLWVGLLIALSRLFS